MASEWIYEDYPIPMRFTVDVSTVNKSLPEASPGEQNVNLELILTDVDLSQMGSVDALSITHIWPILQMEEKEKLSMGE